MSFGFSVSELIFSLLLYLASFSNCAENKGIEPSFRPSPKTRLAGERNKPIFAYSP